MLKQRCFLPFISTVSYNYFKCSISSSELIILVALARHPGSHSSIHVWKHRRWESLKSIRELTGQIKHLLIFGERIPPSLAGYFTAFYNISTLTLVGSRTYSNSRLKTATKICYLCAVLYYNLWNISFKKKEKKKYIFSVNDLLSIWIPSQISNIY